MHSSKSSSTSNANFTFVILHYLDYNESERCISSILELSRNDKKHEYSIVVVDNYSDNGSVEKLQAAYANENQIHFILNNMNVGFSRGNNIGYQYAKKYLNPSFVVVLNNDTYITQHDFAEKCEHTFLEYSPYIIGPDILFTNTGIHKNPDSTELITAEDIVRNIEFIDHPTIKHRLRKKAEHITFIHNYFTRKSIAKDAKRHEHWNQRVINPRFQGSALIFTPLFVATGELPFSPETFLYQEETILAERCRRNNWLTIYEPGLHIFHDSGASTRKSVGDKHIEEFHISEERKAMEIALRYYQN